MPDSATPMPAITPVSTTRITSEVTTAHGLTSPASVESTRKGAATAAKASPVIHAARNLPKRISPVVASVTCTGASVAASRSPLMLLPLRVGETRRISSRVTYTTTE